MYDEFMVGDDILVAPILEKGKLLRDIFLPKGQWTSASGDTYIGPTKLWDFPAPIEDIPYFIRVQ
jgi:alpha-glucosidase (family GH31 glycosyl hydrolase)